MARRCARLLGWLVAGLLWTILIGPCVDPVDARAVSLPSTQFTSVVVKPQGLSADLDLMTDSELQEYARHLIQLAFQRRLPAVNETNEANIGRELGVTDLGYCILDYKISQILPGPATLAAKYASKYATHCVMIYILCMHVLMTPVRTLHKFIHLHRPPGHANGSTRHSTKKSAMYLRAIRAPKSG
jgi:hypothetical protein